MENAINKLNQIVEQLLAAELVSIAIRLNGDAKDTDLHKQMDVALEYMIEARKKLKRAMVYHT